MKKIVLIAGALVLVGLLSATLLKIPENSAPIEISAVDLWNFFIEDKDTAKNRFDGQLIFVSGSVAEVSDAFMGSPCVLLENGIDSIPDGIFCLFPENSLDQVIGLEFGEDITVQGTCSVGIPLEGEGMPYIFINNAMLK